MVEHYYRNKFIFTNNNRLLRETNYLLPDDRIKAEIIVNAIEADCVEDVVGNKEYWGDVFHSQNVDEFPIVFRLHTNKKEMISVRNDLTKTEIESIISGERNAYVFRESHYHLINKSIFQGIDANLAVNKLFPDVGTYISNIYEQYIEKNEERLKIMEFMSKGYNLLLDKINELI